MQTTLPQDHPLRRSCWIWPEGELHLNNCHAQFRHDFELESIPETAPFFITADQSYRLHVNGRYVCRGPARGYQSHWPYDEVDLKEYLVAGHNFISVEAYTPGTGTFQYLHLYAAGLLCAAEWGAVQIHTNKATWQMRRGPGNNPNVARLSRQMAYQEDFDASKDDSSWIASPVLPVWIEEPLYRWSGETRFGILPWATLESRVIPLLREELRVPERIQTHGTGEMKPGYRNAFNLSWQWHEERDSVAEWLPGGTLIADRDAEALSFTALPVEEGCFRAVTVDLGAILVGCLTLELAGCSGREIVDCHFHQYLEGGVPNGILPKDHVSIAARLRAAEGKCGRTFFPIFGARFVTLVFRELDRPLAVRTLWRTAEYPFAMRGEFHTSDALLNDIHAICRHTQQICSLDAYVDTPWREQGQWWGDARVQGRNTFYLDGDDRLLRRGITSIAGQEAPHGLTYGVAPCRSGGSILPDFSLTWILTIYDHYFQTGSLDAFFEQEERIRQIFDYFDSVSSGGIIRYDKRFWLFEDWASLPKEGEPAFINLWHLYTWKHYLLLLRAAKRETVAAEEKIAFLERRIIDRFFDPSRGLFIAGRGEKGEELTTPSLHDQVLAILTGILPEFHANMAEKRLLPFLRGESCDFATPTSFWCTYLFEAAEKMGFRREVLDFIRDRWGRMIPWGGTWEQMEWNEAARHSCCHAWSAHPASHLPDLFFGLHQLAPAWREVECSPASALLPESGRVLLPLPPGDLIFEWRGRELELTVPEGMTLRLGASCLKAGKHRVTLS